MQKPTLRHIAEKTNLSVATVSRILNGKPSRFTKNVELVYKVAQELNYPIENTILGQSPNPVRPPLVALITNFHEGEFYASFFAGMDKAAKQYNMKLGLFNVAFDLEALIETLNDLVAHQYKAAILFMPNLNEPDYEYILKHAPKGLIVLTTASVYTPILDTITFDAYSGGFIVAKHFDSKHYDEVGIILGDCTRVEALRRKSGFTDYIDHHSNMTLSWSYEGDFSLDSGKRAFNAYLQLDKKPRAIFVSNDYMCLGFMQMASAHGIRIPEDLALASYDDLPIAAAYTPTITSVNTDFEILGLQTFKMIEERIQQPKTHEGSLSLIPVQLSKRASS